MKCVLSRGLWGSCVGTVMVFAVCAAACSSTDKPAGAVDQAVAKDKGLPDRTSRTPDVPLLDRGGHLDARHSDTAAADVSRADAPRMDARRSDGPGADISGGPCGTIDWFGCCRGDVLVYCDNGKLVAEDCYTTGPYCAWDIAGDQGYVCTNCDPSVCNADPSGQYPIACP